MPFHHYDDRDDRDMRPSSSLPGYVGECLAFAPAPAPAPAPLNGAPQDGDQPSVHAEMFKLIAAFATKTVWTEGLTLQARLRDLGYDALLRPFMRRMKVHNSWGYAVGVEHGDGRPAPAALWYERESVAIEQLCGLVAKHTPTEFFAPDLAQDPGRGCWDLSWREVPGAGIAGSMRGREGRYSAFNQLRIKRALDSAPIAVDVSKGEPVKKYEWGETANDWALPEEARKRQRV